MHAFYYIHKFTVVLHYTTQCYVSFFDSHFRCMELYNIYWCTSVYTVLFQTMSIHKASTYCSITVMGYCLWNHKCTPGIVYSHSLRFWKYVYIAVIHNPAFW